MGGIGVPELLIVLLIVLVLFGSTRLPKLAKSLGQASREFKKGADDKDAEDKDDAAKPGDEQVTMSKAELDALLAEREAKAREAQVASPPPDIPPSA
jgi:sec-independent protein translocase protein TatA